MQNDVRIMFVYDEKWFETYLSDTNVVPVKLLQAFLKFDIQILCVFF